MPRGFFTQSTTVLFSEAPSLEDVEAALDDDELESIAVDGDSWMGASESLIVPFRAPARGTLQIDVQDRPWPDGMGDPQSDVDLFAAWTMGFFGPLVYPGNLGRACNQAVAYPDAVSVAAKHRAFVRLRTSYTNGDPDSKLIPEGWDPLAELAVLAGYARKLLALPGALAYFDPNGEVILDRAGVDASFAHAERASVPPLDLYTHVRLFNVQGSDFAIMDTVGMDRFFLPDAEVAVASTIDPNAVAQFLMNVSLHHLRKKGAIPDTHTTDGPGGVYRVHHREKSLVPPPRAVARFVPEFAQAPDAFLK